MVYSVKVFPKSSHERLVKKDGKLRAYVKSAPDKGKANKALIALLAREYNVKKKDIWIITGMGSRNKVVEIKK